MWGRASRSMRWPLSPPGRLPWPANDAVADIGGAARQRERPGVTRRHVGLEPDPKLTASGSHAREVLTPGLPIAQVTGLAQPKRLADQQTRRRRPRWHSGRRTARRRRDDIDAAPASMSLTSVTRVPGDQAGARLAGQVEQGGVEVGPAGRGAANWPDWSRASVRAAVPAAVRDGDHDLVHGSQLTDAGGSRPRSSRRRSAAVVSPSPQHLSRGKVALSISTTSRPSRARVMAGGRPGRAGTDHRHVGCSVGAADRGGRHLLDAGIGSGPVLAGRYGPGHAGRAGRGRHDGPSDVVSMSSAASGPVQYRAATARAGGHLRRMAQVGAVTGVRDLDQLAGWQAPRRVRAAARR